MDSEFGCIDSNLQRLEAKLQNIESDLLVLSELFTTGYMFLDRTELAKYSEEIPNGPTIKKIITLAKKYKTFLILGMPEKQGTKLFDTNILVGPEGYVGKNQKKHLFYQENLIFDPGENAYEVFKSFVKNSSATAWPVSADIYKGYEEFFPYAKAIVSLKPPIVPIAVPPIITPITPPIITPVTPPVAKGPAHSFILKNFGDSNISSLSADALQSLLAAFRKTYQQSDDFYSEYQMWSVYVLTRYWELQLLAGVSGAANAFSLTYLNDFKPAYSKNSNSLTDPYAAQLAAMALEFSITYAIARVEIQEINNHLYA